MVGDTASDFRVRRHAAELLGLEALTAAELVEGLNASGIAVGPDGVHRVGGVLDGSSAFIEVSGERWVSVAAQLTGVVWLTVRSEDGAPPDVLALDPDLDLLGWYALDGAARLADGRVLELVELDDGSDGLAGPPEWLAGLSGRTVAVRVDDGVVTVEAWEGDAGASPALVEAVRSVFDAQADRDEVINSLTAFGPVPLVRMTVEDLLWETVIAHREAVSGAPVPPLAVLLDAAGLERSGTVVAPMGTDWAALDRWRRRARLQGLHHLNPAQVDRADALIDVANEVIDLRDPETVAGLRSAGSWLADPEIARTFWGHHMERETPPEVLAGFARQVLADTPIKNADGARWVLGRALDVAGESAEAEAELTAAAAAGFGPALVAVATFAADRGDAARALSLLRQAKVDNEDELLEEVAGYATFRPSPAAGRNNRCPCGSGRKYKVCHLGRERPGLIDRGPWLYAKARRYVRDNGYRTLVGELASVTARSSGRGTGLLLDLLDSELIADLVLCEAGVFDDFVANRHSFLPDDEALLAGTWQLIERSLFEVNAVHPDRLDLRDVRTGDRITVTNTRPDSRTRAGTMLVGRPLPIADTYRAYSGFLPVGSLVDEILVALDDADPFLLAVLYGRILAPPPMTNTDGHPIVLRELTYKLPDPFAARSALSAELTADGDTFTLVRDSLNQPDTIILTGSVAGTELRVSVNSDRRADETRALIARLLPDATLIDEDVADMDEHLANATRTAPPSTSIDDPRLAEVLARVVRQHEARWLDESIPALHGRTPREAAADPVGRCELEQLLRTFDHDDGQPGMMSTSRLRRALGL